MPATADSKTMFETLDKLLNKTVKLLPECDSMTGLCNEFAGFFNEKVAVIRNDLDMTSASRCPSVACIEYCKGHTNIDEVITQFNEVTVEDVCKIIRSMPSKSCQMDTMPVEWLKDNVDTLAKPLTAIINQSFSSGTLPSKLREAVVTPILKKPTLNKDVLKNYRPVSNINYVSKIMEKIVWLIDLIIQPQQIWEKVYFKSQILVHEYWTILDHFCVPVL